MKIQVRFEIYWFSPDDQRTMKVLEMATTVSAPAIPRPGDLLSFAGNELALLLTGINPLEVEEVHWISRSGQDEVLMPIVTLRSATQILNPDASVAETMTDFKSLVLKSQKSLGNKFKIITDYPSNEP